MSEVILHHYPGSPFSEKVRLLLGSKGLSWRSVIIPVVMPKPDLLALTGGYRRTPVMQIGCDVYCDSALIAEVIERLAPARPFFPAGQAARMRMASHWVDSVLFSAAVSYGLQPDGLARLFPDPKGAEALFADRTPFLSGGSAQVLVPPEDAATALHSVIAWVEADLKASGKPFHGGDTPAILDFCLYHPLWFVDAAGLLDALLAGRPTTRAWMMRMRDIGHGNPVPMNAEEALTVAGNSMPDLPEAFDASGLVGAAPGDSVDIAATDYGVDPTTGSLVTVTQNEFVIAREDARAGKVHVHFPRVGFRLSKR